MGLFGDLDVTDISDPNEIGDGVYFATCIDITSIDKIGSITVVLTWKINEPDSEYHNFQKNIYFNNLVFDKIWENLSSEEKRSFKYYKKHIKGATGWSEAELAEKDLNDMIGIKSYLTLRTKGGYTNITDAVAERLYKKEDKSASIYGI